MPRLPDLTQLGRRPVPQSRQGIAQQDTTAAGRGMAQVGQAIDQISDVVTKVEQDKQRAQAGLVLAKTTNDSHGAFGEISRGIADGSVATDKAESLLDKRLQEIQEKAVEGLSDNQRRILASSFEQTKGGLKRDLAGVVFKRNQSDIAGAIDQYGELKQREVGRIGPAAASESYGAFVDFNAGSAGLPPERAAAAKQKFKESAFHIYFDSKATDAYLKGNMVGLGEVLRELEGPAGENLDPLRRAGLQRQYHAWQESIAATDKYRTAVKIQDFESAVLNGEGDRIPLTMVPTIEDAKVMHPKGEDATTFYQQKIEPLLKIQGGVQMMKNATPEERDNIVAGAKPDVAPGYAGAESAQQALLKAKNLVEQRIVADPADYVIKNSSRARNAAAVFNRVLADTSLPADLKQQEVAAAGRFYAEVMNAEQYRLGVDTIRDERTGNKNKKPRLITNAEANAIADQFAEGGPKAADFIRAQEMKWGALWPQVYGQLAQDTKLPPAALVIPNMPDDASRAALAQASSMKPEELKALVSSSDPKDIQDRLLGQFADAQRTFVSQGTSGNKTLAAVMGEAEKLALLYRSRGDSVNDAADKAFNKVMGWKYVFAETYRIPQDKQQMSAREVRDGASVALTDLMQTGGLSVFADGQADAAAVMDALKTRALWVNNSDETGLQLMVQGSDGAILAVNGKDGRPVQVDWNTLITNARKPPTETSNTDSNRGQQARGFGFGAEVEAARKARDGVPR
jgi:hypothetical protein